MRNCGTPHPGVKPAYTEQPTQANAKRGPTDPIKDGAAPNPARNQGGSTNERNLTVNIIHRFAGEALMAVCALTLGALFGYALMAVAS